MTPPTKQNPAVHGGSIKQISLTIILMLTMWSAAAQTNIIWGYVGDYTTTPPSARIGVTFQILSPNPRTVNASIISQNPMTVWANTTNGYFSITNLLFGYYSVTLNDTLGTTFHAWVYTTSTGTIPLAALTSNDDTEPPNPGTNYYTQAQTDAMLANLTNLNVGGASLGAAIGGSNGAALLMTLGIDHNGNLSTNAPSAGGSATNALAQGPGGIYDASLVTNVQSTALVGQISLAQLPAQAVTNILPTAISQNLFNWWDAELMGYTNGQTISQWMPLVGTNILTAGGSPIYTNNGIGGHPAIYFDGVSAVYTNQNYAVNNPQLSTNCAIFVVYKNFNEAAVPYGVYLWSFGTPTTRGLLFFPELNTPGQGTAVAAIGETNGHSFLAANSMNQRDNVAAFWEYNQTNGGLFLNGKIGDSTTWYSLTQPWGVFGNFVLGNYCDFTGPYFFNGNISEVLVYTNRLDISQVQSINDYLTTKYHARKSNIVLDGDSITVSNVQYPTNAISVQVASALGAAVNVDCTALSGHSSANQLTNAAFWITTGHPEASANIILDNESANNDFGQGITTAQTESNWLAKATMAHTWGWKYIPCSIISSSNLDLSGNKTVLNAWLLANWSTFADNICRYDQIAAIATNGAWSNNVVFNTDGIHPNDAGMLLEGPVAIAAIKAVLSGTNFNGSFTGSFAGTAVVPSLTQVATGTPQVRVVNQGSLDNAYDIWYGDHVNRHGDWIIGPADNVADLSSGGILAWTWRFVNDNGSTPNYGLNGLGYLVGIETNGSLHVYGNGIFSNNVVVSGTVIGNGSGLTNIQPAAVTNGPGFWAAAPSGGGSSTFLPSPTVTWSTSGGSNVATVVSSPLLTGSQSNLLSLAVTNTENGVTLSGAFTGSLAGNATTSTTAAMAGNLTTINTNNINTNNASQLSSGTVPSAVLSGNSITNATGFFFPAGGGGINAATAQAIALQAATTNTANTSASYTNNGSNFYLGLPGGNVGNLNMADSVLNQWDTLLGQNGNPYWNGSQLAKTNSTGVTLAGTFTGQFSGATTNDSGQPYGVAGLVTNGIQNSSMFAAGANYLSIGSNAIVNATNGGVSIGINSQATGTNSVAIGKNAVANNNLSTANGNLSTASGSYSTASGPDSTASGSFSTASGSYSTASGPLSTASGYNSIASGPDSTASGPDSTASGNYSTASGYSSTASGNYSTAIGANAKSAASNSIAIGPYSYVPVAATNAIAVGNYASATATNASAWGANSTNATPNSIKFGYEGFPGYQVMTPGTIVASNGFVSMQPTATTFQWSAIPFYSATVTNYWIGTWTNGTYCAIYSNTASSYAIKQLAP